jgi:hypothetical protein
MLKVVMAYATQSNALTVPVQDGHSVARSDTRTDTGNWNVKLLLKLFDARPIAPPGAKKKFVVFAASEGGPCAIVSRQGAVSCREWQLLFGDNSSNTAGFAYMF